MNSKRTAILALIMAVISVVACLMLITLPPTEEQVNVTNEIQEEEIEIVYKQRVEGYTVYMKVIHDNKRNVTCWKLGPGISCIPDHMLTP